MRFGAGYGRCSFDNRIFLREKRNEQTKRNERVSAIPIAFQEIYNEAANVYLNYTLIILVISIVEVLFSRCVSLLHVSIIPAPKLDAKSSIR